MHLFVSIWKLWFSQQLHFETVQFSRLVAFWNLNYPKMSNPLLLQCLASPRPNIPNEVLCNRSTVNKGMIDYIIVSQNLWVITTDYTDRGIFGPNSK